jgi:hypothetical protein
MAWNLHLVGEALEDELEAVLAKFITDLEGVGHHLTGATLTTDTGQKELPTAPVDVPAQTVGGEPVVGTDTPTVPPAAAPTPPTAQPVKTDTPPAL